MLGFVIFIEDVAGKTDYCGRFCLLNAPVSFKTESSVDKNGLTFNTEQIRGERVFNVNKFKLQPVIRCAVGTQIGCYRVFFLVRLGNDQPCRGNGAG